jgi:hypothetical protein
MCRVSPAGATIVLAAIAIAGCGGATHRKSATQQSTTTAVEVDTSAKPGKASTIQLQSQLSTHAPNPKAVSAPGSQIVFDGMLFTPHGSTAIGRFQESCTRTAPGNGDVFQCLLTYVLAKGVIYGQADASSQGPANGAITGGTGQYANVRGTFQYRSSGSPRINLTFNVAP